MSRFLCVGVAVGGRLTKERTLLKPRGDAASRFEPIKRPRVRTVSSDGRSMRRVLSRATRIDRRLLIGTNGLFSSTNLISATYRIESAHSTGPEIRRTRRACVDPRAGKTG